MSEIEHIAVILPYYNRAATLIRCIDSVFVACKQFRSVTNKALCLSLVAVDNNSTDGSRKIIEECSNPGLGGFTLYSLSCHAQGAAAARNTGINFCLSHFSISTMLVFLDSDDELMPDLFVRASQDWDAKSIISYCLEPIAHGRTITESGRSFLRRFFVTGRRHQNCALWNRIYPLGLWENIRIPNIPYFEDLGGLLPLLLQPGIQVKLVSSYCGYKLNTDVPGATRCEKGDCYFRSWLISLGYVSEIPLPRPLGHIRDSYVAGYFLEIWPRYHLDKDPDQNVIMSAIRRPIRRSFYITFRPKNAKDYIKKMMFILLGASRYRQAYIAISHTS